MSIKEQKEILIQKIIAEKDEKIIDSLIHLLDRDFLIGETEKIYLTEHQKKEIQKGLNDIKEDRIYFDYEAKQLIQKKLDSYK